MNANKIMEELVKGIANMIEQELPDNHKFCVMIIPTDNFESSMTGIASSLDPKQLVELLESLADRVKQAAFKPKNFIN